MKNPNAIWEMVVSKEEIAGIQAEMDGVFQDIDPTLLLVEYSHPVRRACLVNELTRKAKQALSLEARTNVALREAIFKIVWVEDPGSWAAEWRNLSEIMMEQHSDGSWYIWYKDPKVSSSDFLSQKIKYVKQLRSELAVGLRDAKEAIEQAGMNYEEAKASLLAKGCKTIEETRQGDIGLLVRSTQLSHEICQQSLKNHNWHLGDTLTALRNEYNLPDNSSVLERNVDDE